MARILPNMHLFLYLYIRKEALLSSQIEGTQSSFSDLLRSESETVPGAPIDDVREVSNYVKAMEHGLKRIENGFPVSTRLFREVHEILLARGRGSSQNPGEFRRTQNWIGGTRPGNAVFVPPPPQEVMPLMSDLEKFIHADTPNISHLVKAGLVHVQFETIHPFLDGNGRLGRLLITLLLCSYEVLSSPLLYLSLHFKAHRQQYYNLLQKARENGDWEAWMEFFLTGIAETSQQAVASAQEILSLFEQDQRTVETTAGRSAATALRVHQFFQKKPIVKIPELARGLSLSPPTAHKHAQALEKFGILEEITNGKYGRTYAYSRYIKILSQGAEPL